MNNFLIYYIYIQKINKPSINVCTLMGLSQSVAQSFETAMIAKMKGIPETKNTQNAQKEKGAEKHCIIPLKQASQQRENSLQQESQHPQHSLQIPSQQCVHL